MKTITITVEGTDPPTQQSFSIEVEDTLYKLILEADDGQLAPQAAAVGMLAMLQRSCEIVDADQLPVEARARNDQLVDELREAMRRTEGRI